MERHRVTRGGKRIDLTPGECKLGCALVEDPERVFSRQDLLDRIYRYGESALVDRAVDVHIANLRKKLGDDPSNPRLIGTVRGPATGCYDGTGRYSTAGGAIVPSSLVPAETDSKASTMRLSHCDPAPRRRISQASRRGRAFR